MKKSKDRNERLKEIFDTNITKAKKFDISNYKDGESAFFERVMDESRAYPLLSEDDKIILIEEAKKGNQKAFDFLIGGDMGLIVRMVMDYKNQYFFVGTEDLFQEAVLGYMRAILNYKREKSNGCKFSSYAQYFITNRIRKVLSKMDFQVSRPESATKKTCAYITVRNIMTISMGREPSLEEMSEELGIPVKKIEKSLNWRNRFVPLDVDSFDDVNNLRNQNLSTSDMLLFCSSFDTDDEILFKSMLDEHLMLIGRVLSALEIFLKESKTKKRDRFFF